MSFVSDFKRTTSDLCGYKNNRSCADDFQEQRIFV